MGVMSTCVGRVARCQAHRAFAVPCVNNKCANDGARCGLSASRVCSRDPRSFEKAQRGGGDVRTIFTAEPPRRARGRAEDTAGRPPRPPRTGAAEKAEADATAARRTDFFSILEPRYKRPRFCPILLPSDSDSDESRGKNRERKEDLAL